MTSFAHMVDKAKNGKKQNAKTEKDDVDDIDYLHDGLANRLREFLFC